MAGADFGTGKSLVVLAIVVGCFAILWPKIFYPMMQTAFAMTSPKMDADSPFRESDRPPHLHPGSINPRLRNSMGDDVQDKFHMREGRPFPHPQARQPAKAQPKSGGAMSIIMPIYTVGIIVFFLYTVLKLVFKKPSEAEKKPLIKDFHMDAEYRKFVCQQPANDMKKVPKESKKPQKKPPKLSETAIPENQDPALDEKDYEIFKLKKKLAETEQAMERIMKHMGAMSACISEKIPEEKTCSSSEKSDVRLRHKGSTSKQEKNNKISQNCQEVDNSQMDHEGCKKLQADLAKIISMSTVQDSCTKTGFENPMYNSITELSEELGADEVVTASEDEDRSEVEHSCNEDGNDSVKEGENLDMSAAVKFLVIVMVNFYIRFPF